MVKETSTRVFSTKKFKLSPSTSTKPSGGVRKKISGVLNNSISNVPNPSCGGGGGKRKKKMTQVLAKNLITNGTAKQPSALWCAPFKAEKKMVAASYYLPKESQNYPLGEDAHFISKDEQKLGVADGVGSWARKGIDAGKYARELMCNALVEMENQDKVSANPWMALNRAYIDTKAEGSSTACVLTLGGLSKNVDIIHAVNMGDSGFLVIRSGKIVYQSPAQQHKFNVPYQLRKSSLDKNNTPLRAQVFAVPVQTGDIVVLATDGLFDNLFSYEIEDIINKCRENEKEKVEEVMAKALATAAREESLFRWGSNSTPFSVAAAKEERCHSGGKYDDVTVIVARIF